MFQTTNQLFMTGKDSLWYAKYFISNIYDNIIVQDSSSAKQRSTVKISDPLGTWLDVQMKLMKPSPQDFFNKDSMPSSWSFPVEKLLLKGTYPLVN